MNILFTGFRIFPPSPATANVHERNISIPIPFSGTKNLWLQKHSSMSGQYFQKSFQGKGKTVPMLN
jgi:hypothetical protein